MADPPFDVAWRGPGGELVVAEVKSATLHNLESQLRLGLGQLLRYAGLLEERTHRVTAVLAVDLAPGEDWIDLCKRHSVTLVWRGVLERAIGLEFGNRPASGIAQGVCEAAADSGKASAT